MMSAKMPFNSLPVSGNYKPVKAFLANTSCYEMNIVSHILHRRPVIGLYPVVTHLFY